MVNARFMSGLHKKTYRRMEVIHKLHLLFFRLVIVLVDVEVLQGVAFLVLSNDSEPLSEVVLLQVSLGQVLQVSLGESDVTADDQVALGGVDLNLLAQVANLAFDLDVLGQVLVEAGNIENAIVNWRLAVDGKLSSVILRL